jgi:uncharacterized protein YndB with AHSA1/START domain
VQVPIPLDPAFARFLELGRWWPTDYAFEGHGALTAALEPGRGGRWHERDRHGVVVSGEVRLWLPPRRLGFSWRPGPCEASASLGTSEVVVEFDADGPSSTRLVLVHRQFARHGGVAAHLRQRMASSDGWPRILAGYQAYVG